MKILREANNGIIRFGVNSSAHHIISAFNYPHKQNDDALEMISFVNRTMNHDEAWCETQLRYLRGAKSIDATGLEFYFLDSELSSLFKDVRGLMPRLSAEALTKLERSDLEELFSKYKHYRIQLWKLRALKH